MPSLLFNDVSSDIKFESSPLIELTIVIALLWPSFSKSALISFVFEFKPSVTMLFIFCSSPCMFEIVSFVSIAAFTIEFEILSN